MVLSVSSTSWFIPTKATFLLALHQVGLQGSDLDYGLRSMDVSWAQDRLRKSASVSVLKQILQMLYQLVLTASISLGRCWARHIQIGSNAMPVKITTMVKLLANFTSQFGIHSIL